MQILSNAAGDVFNIKPITGIRAAPRQIWPALVVKMFARSPRLDWSRQLIFWIVEFCRIEEIHQGGAGHEGDDHKYRQNFHAAPTFSFDGL
jgi:hypothetical protein